MRTILIHEWVTGGGLAGQMLPASWAAEGGAMRRAICRDFSLIPGIRVLMTLDAGLPDEPGPWETIRIGPGEEWEQLRQLASRSDFTAVIAPESSGLLEERAALLAKIGAKSLGSTPEAIAVAGDKLRVSELLNQRQIPTPRSQRVEPALGLPDDFPYPAVLKPIDGAGSVDTFLVSDASWSSGGTFTGSAALIQPLIDGIPMSASLLVGKDGAVLIALGRQDVSIRAGRFAYSGGRLPADPRAIDANVLAAVDAIPGLAGFVGVDYLWDEAKAEATIVEVNPRPTTAYGGLSHILPAGMLARAWLDAITGEIGPESGGLAEVVHSRPPIRFRADGTITLEPGGVES